MPFRYRSLLVAIAAVAGVAAPPVLADEADGLDLSATVRLRYEAIAGQARAGFDRVDGLVNLRTQLFARYDAKPLRLVAEIFDSRVWGDDRGTPIGTGEVNALELVQAYAAADLGPVLGKGTTTALQAGRFMLNFGSRRLVAAGDYRNTPNGFTGLRADITAPGQFDAVAIFALPQVRLPDDAASLRRAAIRRDRESFDLVLWGGLLGKTLAPSGSRVEAGFFHLGERDAPSRPTRDRSLNTVSLRVIVPPRTGCLDYEIEGMAQWGRVSASTAATATRLPVRASFIHADGGYTFASRWQPRLSFEFDRASGDGPGRAFGRFDTYFGMRRSDFAPSGLYSAVGRTNVVAAGARLEVVPSKRLDGFASYHGLWLADRRDAFSTTGVRDASGRSGAFAGHQIDTRLRYWLQPQRLRLELDGILLFKGRFLRDAPNAPRGRTTRYGSINLTASL